MGGTMVGLGVGDARAQGYLALPAKSPAPAVIVIQEWWGLVPHIKAVADRFAAAGFVALAPDVYRGESADGPDEAGRLFMALDIARAIADLDAAVVHLLARPEVGPRKLGAVGFCMGGQLALAAACKARAIGAVVDFYGVHPKVTLDLAQLAAPVLGLFAERDAFVTPESARKLERELRAAGVATDFHIYPGVDHAFFNDSRPDVYNREAAADAWDRTTRFLRKNLA